MNVHGLYVMRNAQSVGAFSTMESVITLKSNQIPLLNMDALDNSIATKSRWMVNIYAVVKEICAIKVSEKEVMIYQERMSFSLGYTDSKL